MITGQFGKCTTRISICISYKRLGCGRVVFLIIITHTQHVKGFLRFIRTFQNGNQLVQQCSRTPILPFGKVVFSCLILVFVISTFQQFIILSTRGKRSSCKQSYNDIFLHSISNNAQSYRIVPN